LHRFQSAIRDRPALLACAAAAALTAFTLLGFTPAYQTNDDATMNLTAAGLLFTDAPDEHLLHTNVLIGLGLKNLYGAAPGVPWYGIYQIAVLTAAAAGCAYALLRVDPSPRQAALVLLIFVVAFLPCLVELQFTKTACLTTVAGLLMFLAPLRGAAPWRWPADFAAGVLLVFGSLIRFEGFLMALVVVAPLAVVTLWADRVRTLRRAVPVASAVVVAVALHEFNFAYYSRDPAWQDFYAYNAVRAEITDYGRFEYSEDCRPAFKAAGWEPIDLLMMTNWFYADPNLYGLSKLREINGAVRPAPRIPVWLSILRLPVAIADYPSLWRLLAAAACVGLSGATWRSNLLTLTLFLWVFAITAALASYYQIPLRVAFPLFAGALAVAALRPPAEADSRASRFAGAGRVAAIVLGGVLVVWTIAGLVVQNIHRARTLEESTQLLVDMKRELHLGPDTLVVVWADTLPLAKLMTPLGNTKVLEDVHCVSLSGLWPTPFTERQLARFDIADLYRAITERRDVFLVANPKLMQLFGRYVQLHYGLDPSVREWVFSHGGSQFFVYESSLHHETNRTK
jgi:hypothetical protein